MSMEYKQILFIKYSSSEGATMFLVYVDDIIMIENDTKIDLS